MEPGPASAPLWFVSELFWPEETSTGYFVTRIAEDMAHAGYEVRALCSQPTYSARGIRAPRREQHNGISIERIPSTTLNKDVIAFRLVNVLTFCINIFLRALKRFRPGDIVVCVTNPPLLPYVVRAAAAIRRARFVLLIHDVYPEVLVATGAARAGAPHVRCLDALSRSLYRSSDRVVVLGRDMHALVSAKAPAATPRLRHIPNWGDVETVRPDTFAGEAIRERLGLGSKFVVGYVGNIGRTHDIDVLVDAADLLRGRDDIHFLFVGWGAQRDRLERELQVRGLSNSSLHGPCAAGELSGHLNASDILTISFRPGMAGISVPSRLYNMMAAGRPVLAITDGASELARVVLEEDIGWVTAPGDADSIVRLLSRLAGDRRSLHAAGGRARSVAVAQYSRASVGAAWQALFHEMGSTTGIRDRAG